MTDNPTQPIEWRENASAEEKCEYLLKKLREVQQQAAAADKAARSALSAFQQLEARLKASG